MCRWCGNKSLLLLFFRKEDAFFFVCRVIRLALKGLFMDRQIVYPGSVPLDTDLLNVQRNVMSALGYLAQVTLGTSTVVDGLACAPTSPASMSISVGPGSITQFGVVDTTAFGSLAAQSDPLLRLAVNLTSNLFTLAAPSVPGESINYLVEASLVEADASPIVLPYYNSANPSQPYSGPGNSGASQMTQRLQSVQLQVKAGAPGATGSQQTPGVDAGWVGLYVISVVYGDSAVTASNIFVYPTAPFLTWKLPQLTPGTHNLAVFGPTTQGGWQVPSGVTGVKVRIWGGGGAGGAGFSGPGGGGSGGGYCEGFYSVTPGEMMTITVGNGGAGSGQSGGTSSFGALASATGGQAGADGTPTGSGSGGAAGGVGSGSGLSVNGSPGGPAFGLPANGSVAAAWMSGAGGGSFGSAGAVSVVSSAGGVTLAGVNGVSPGAGGSGGIEAGLGGSGGPGLVLVEW
jgi:hypothetical protein